MVEGLLDYMQCCKQEHATVKNQMYDVPYSALYACIYILAIAVSKRC